MDITIRQLRDGWRWYVRNAAGIDIAQSKTYDSFSKARESARVTAITIINKLWGE